MSTPDRVRTVIATSGLSQGDFAVAVGLDPSKMSKSLSGTRRFTSLDLARIADVAQVTVDWLLTGDEPALATAARAAAGSDTASAVGVARSIGELRETAGRLGFPARLVPFTAPMLRGTWAQQGSSLADAAVAHCEAHGVVSTGADLADVIESAFGIDVGIVELGDGVDGLAAVSADASLILASPSPMPGRQRFTLAHELGHVLAGDDQQVHVDKDIYGVDSRRGESEVRANSFAAAFLMPEHLLRQRLTALDERSFAGLAIELSVSPRALAIRLETLRIIDAMTRDRWGALSYRDAMRAAMRAPEALAAMERASAQRPPRRLERDLFTAYDQGLTTLRPYAALLGADLDQLRASLEDPSSAQV